MKYFSVTLVILTVALPLWGQPKYVIGWPKYVISWLDTLDNSDYDYARAVSVDSTGNIYVTGYSYIGSDYDILTVKYDSIGNTVWLDTLDIGNNNDEAYGIAVDGDGNIHITGNSYIGSDYYDFITVTYDSMGNVLRVDTLNRSSVDKAYGIAVDRNGNVYVAGTTTSSGDYLTVKYDSVGNIIWERTLDNGSSDYARGVAVDNANNVYVTGYTFIGGPYEDFLTVKYDSAGNIQWLDTLDISNNDESYGVVVDNRGNVYVAGHAYNGSNMDYITVRYDTSGNTIWIDTLDNGDNDYARGIAVDRNGNIYVTGYSVIGGDYHFLTVRYDSLGNILWMDSLGILGLAYGTAVDKSGNIFVTGNRGNDYLTVKFEKFVDAGLLSIASPDSVSLNSSYTPEVWAINNSYEDTLTFDVGSYIDSSGRFMYGDTQSVSNLPPGDSTLVIFSPWSTPQNQMNLTLRFSILSSDMVPPNDTIFKALYVSGISEDIDPDGMVLNVHPLNSGTIAISYGASGKDDFRIYICSIDGRVVRKIAGRGHHTERITGLASGVYLVRLEHEGKVIIRKVCLVR